MKRASTYKRHSGGIYTPGGFGMPRVAEQVEPWRVDAGNGFINDAAIVSGHPLYDASHNRRLLERESQITEAFNAIEPALKDIAAQQSQDGFAERAAGMVNDRLGIKLSPCLFRTDWLHPLNMREIYAQAVFETFKRLADQNFDRSHADMFEGESADELIRNWGFHAIDISPCADGRLSGVVDYILRIPGSIVAHRKSFAGAMFDIEESMRNWSEIELRRYRENIPNPASDPTRYLKIGVYHFSSSDPSHEGCAAHGSNERLAAQTLLDRLNAFAQGIENTHCCGASVAVLLVGVDTDTDAIKVHVPDANGNISVDRFLDNKVLHAATQNMARDAAKEAIRLAVAEAAGVAPDDPATEGMRWFCGYLLKNNIAQIEYVRAYHNGQYDNLGHTERLITVGEGFDTVQLRNLAYQAQMDTVEEGAPDMDVGIKIFKHTHVERGLPAAVLVHFKYDGKVPGSRERAEQKTRRLIDAIRARYESLVREGWIYTRGMLENKSAATGLEELDDNFALRADGTRACGCNEGV